MIIIIIIIITTNTYLSYIMRYTRILHISLVYTLECVNCRNEYFKFDLINRNQNKRTIFDTGLILNIIYKIKYSIYNTYIYK